jgi:hypothetical protein
MPGLGRLRVEDPRDARFPLRSLADARAAAAPKPRRDWKMFHRPLDQGAESTCVGHGWRHWMVCAPIIQVRAKDPPYAVQIYDLATRADEWTGNEGDRDFGTSVRAGAQVLRSMGYIESFHWAFTVDEVIRWLQFGGPLVLGTDWFRSMFETDDEGILRVDERSGLAGGHAYVLNGYDVKRGLFDGINSWGPDWGNKGRFDIPAEGLRLLLERAGEACTAPELRLPNA